MAKKQRQIDWADINVQVNIMVLLTIIAGLLIVIAWKLFSS